MWKDIAKKPNFFIIGAPKCGTTSVADWLSNHPNVFMCDPKEPHYFNTDSMHKSTFSPEEYESYFERVDPQIHQSIGEASVWYLISEDSISNILEFQTSARFIVCLRNPVEAAVSLHDQKLFSGDETEPDFWTAWNLQAGRKTGQHKVPFNCMDVRELMYGESCLFGSLFSRVLEKVGRERVHAILMDDLRANPGAVYGELLDFLNLKHDKKASFPVANASKRRYLISLQRVLRKVTILKQKMGIRRGVGFGKYLNALNRSSRPRPSLDADKKKELVSYFSSDIDRLEELLNRSLQHWKNV